MFESTFLATVDKLARVHALNSQEVLFPGLKSVRIPEVHNSKWGTTARIVDDVLQWNSALSTSSVTPKTTCYQFHTQKQPLNEIISFHT